MHSRDADMGTSAAPKAVMLQEDGAHRPLRERLLRSAVTAHLSGLAPDSIAEIDAIEEDDPATLALFGDLAFLPPAARVPPLISLGLVAHPDLARTRPKLVCTRPLGAELKALAQRCDAETTRHPRWTEGVLGLFERVVFVDRFHLAQSLGFSPWASFGMVDHYPLPLPAPDPGDGEIRLLVIDHGIDNDETATVAPEALARALGSGHEVIDLRRAGEGAAAAEQLPAADLHVHLNYANLRPVNGVTPQDSILSGAYTIVQPVRDSGTSLLGQKLAALVDARSYARALSPEENPVPAIRDMARRIATLRASPGGGNPEIETHTGDNAARRTKAMAAFEAELFA